MRSVIGCLLVGAVLAGASSARADGSSSPSPKVVPYEDGAAVPRGYHLEERSRRGLIVAGAIVGGTAWLLTGVVSALAKSDHYGGIPLVGPYLSWATANSKDVEPSFWALSAAVQTGAAAMLVCGIVLKRTVAVRDEEARVIVVAPIAFGGGEGVAAIGTF